MSNYNIHKIQTRRSYNITEMAFLLGTDRKTCSRWIKNEGLRVIEESVSPLVIGADLKDFIIKRKAKKKTHLEENEFFCFKCHKAVKAKTESEKIIKTGKRIGKENREQLQKTGICEICGTEIYKYLGVCQKD